MTKRGKFISNQVIIQPHEMRTVELLLKQGWDVELCPRSLVYGVKSADIIVNGKIWEIKCPKGDGRWTIKNILQDAPYQSRNIILDLRRTKLREDVAIRYSKYEFERLRNVDQMIIIDKHSRLFALRSKK